MSNFRDRLRDRKNSRAAYTLVDLSGLDDDLRQDILQDANEGGGTYGIRVVEESVNGAARAPIYGVYNEGPDAERWAKAKEELDIAGSEVDDAEIYGGAGVIVADPAREAALREAAAQRADALADSIRSGENAEVAAITGDTAGAGGGTTGGDHPQNIVDPGLAQGATNEAGNAKADAAATDAAKKSANKAPK